MIKLFQPYVSPKAHEYVKEVLASGQLAEGPKVKKFEEEFEKYFQKSNVLAVNSGTSALELAYHLADIKEGDEVLTPALTCSATNLPLARRGAKIVWVDTDEDLNISVKDLEQKITKWTKAIVFVHFGGNNRGLKEVSALARRHGIKLIEDAAQAVGTEYWGIGDYTAVSLQAIKTLTTGDGGLLLTSRREDYLRAKKLRWFGYDRELKQKLGDTDIYEAGYKYHMNDISAAIGLANLEDMPEVLEYRYKLRHEYIKNGLYAHMWFGYCFTENLTELQATLREQGYESGVHHYRNDKYAVFGGPQPLPNLDSYGDKFLLLPLHMGVTVEDVKKICQICTK